MNLKTDLRKFEAWRQLRGFSKRDLLDYEVFSSWWACLLSWDWAQGLAAKYFAWKVNRKYRRYEKSLEYRKSTTQGSLFSRS